MSIELYNNHTLFELIQSYYEINIGHVLLVYLKSIYTNESNTQALHPLRFQV